MDKLQRLAAIELVLGNPANDITTADRDILDSLKTSISTDPEPVEPEDKDQITFTFELPTQKLEVHRDGGVTISAPNKQ